MEGVSREMAMEAFNLAKAKLPFKVSFEEREVM
jgi:large subunit ribosomal protein L16